MTQGDFHLMLELRIVKKACFVHGQVGVAPDSVFFAWFIGLKARNGVMSAKPAVEVNLRTAQRAEGVKFLCRGLFANRARPAGLQVNRINHQTPVGAGVIHE
jgi:hypothetical protein